MDGYYRPTTDHLLLESNLSSSATLTSSEKVFMCENLNKMEFEEDENELDNYSQMSTPSCVSKMDYTLPKYRNNAKEHLDMCFSSPKPFVNTYKTDIADDCARSNTKEIDLSLSQTVREPLSSGWQEIADSLPDVEPVVDAPRYKDNVYASEAYFLLMASNRNRMQKALMSERSRRDSKDSAFSEFMGSDEE